MENINLKLLFDPWPSIEGIVKISDVQSSSHLGKFNLVGKFREGLLPVLKSFDDPPSGGFIYRTVFKDPARRET